jgi:hypothetical protein
MTVAEIDIETIVREVIRRLRDVTSEAASGNDVTQPTIAGTQRVAPSLELNDRVVTLATLDGKLIGIQTIVIGPRAIITPAVRDELQQRKITIQRSASAKPNGVAKLIATSGLTVAVATSGVCEVELRKLVGKSVNVVKRLLGDAAADAQLLVPSVVAGGRGVLITSTPAAAVMIANRTSGVRAAYGFNFPAIRRAKEEIDANLLVIEPAGKSVAELVGMIAEFERK